MTASVRAFAVPPTEPPSTARRAAPLARRWPAVALVFDTETTTDPSQRLLFGCYRVLSWAADSAGRPRLQVEEEGAFYGDDLPTRDPAGFRALQAFARSARAETPPTGDRTFYCYPRRAFLDEVVWRIAVAARGLVVGYNLPFDLARLASHAGPTKPRVWTDPHGRRHRPSYVDAWSLLLWQRPDGTPDRFRPRIHVKHLDRNRSLIKFAPVPKGAKITAGEGAFLDLKTLVFALTDEGMSLAKAGAAFNAPVRKSQVDEFGVITPASLRYGRQDVRATASLLEVVRHEFDRHPLAITPMAVRSPATLAKGYLRAMGITPPLARATGITPRQLGQASSTYFGGRAECRIRNVVVPVVSTDVTSMYPTVQLLAQLQPFLTADRLTTVTCLPAARAALAAITPDQLLTATPWPTLRFFAEVIPDGDILPLRTTYDPRNPVPTIGVNPVTSREPLWYTGFDLAASILLTGGRVPRIRRAFTLRAQGSLASLTPVAFRGAVPIDPRCDNIFRTVIETRHRVRRDPALPVEEREALQRGLKVNANAGSYGVLAEFTAHRLPGTGTETVRVEYGSRPGFDARVRSPETPGEYCFPPLAAWITGAARLVLALTERLVADRGGTYLAMDTDSIHIVASPRGGLVPCPGGPDRDAAGRPAIRALSWAEVDAVVAALDRLKPYGPDVRSALLKIEEENFSPRDAGRRQQLYGLALAAKRYVLFNATADGPEIRSRSDHGLGVYLDPADPRPRSDSAGAADPNTGWVAEVWRRMVRGASGRPRGRVPSWYARPAVIQFTASSPDRLRPYEAQQRRQSYADRLKPFTFMLAVNVFPDSVAPPLHRQQHRIIAPFERNPMRWFDLPWRDLYTGTHCQVATRGAGAPGVVVAESIGDMVAAYERHPEGKSLGWDGAPCRGSTTGLLRRRPVHVIDLAPIGKEAGHLEEVDEGLLREADPLLVTYQAPEAPAAEWGKVVAALQRLPTAEMARLATRIGVAERTLWRYRTGETTKSRTPRPLAEWLASPPR